MWGPATTGIGSPHLSGGCRFCPDLVPISMSWPTRAVAVGCDSSTRWRTRSGGQDPRAPGDSSPVSALDCAPAGRCRTRLDCPAVAGARSQLMTGPAGGSVMRATWLSRSTRGARPMPARASPRSSRSLRRACDARPPRPAHEYPLPASLPGASARRGASPRHAAAQECLTAKSVA